MQAEELIRQYLPQVNVMQLATSANNQPWVCTVHYYSDEDLNFYWISRPDREHSKHIAHNPQAAAYALVHENTPHEEYVIGISVAGTAELVSEHLPSEIGKAYIEKLGKDLSLLADIASDKNPHKFYRLKPSKIVLFDSKNFPESPRQERSFN